MSKKLALSSAASVLMMAGFALFGGSLATASDGVSQLSGLTQKAALPAMPALSQLPLLR